MTSSHSVSRRGFLKTGGAAALAPAPARPAPAAGKLRFSCMVTFEDWAAGVGTWGEIGVYYILRRIRDCGFYRVFWRVSGSGQASYPSKVATPISFYEPYDAAKYPEHMYAPGWKRGDNWWDPGWFTETPKGGKRQLLDFSHFDSVRIARDFSRELGLEFWLWQEQAEDHGGIGQIGRMGLRHPEWFTRNRDGKRSRCRFSFAIEPAMEYRRAWVRELLEYEPDGIYFDFTKSMEGSPDMGCTPHFDEKGVWYCTYDAPAVEAFRKQNGRDPFRIPNDDPEWVRFRAGYFENFVRGVRELQRSTFPKVKLGLFGCPSGRAGLAPSDRIVPLADPFRAYLEDHEGWTGRAYYDEFVTAYTSQADWKKPDKIKSVIADSRPRVKEPCRYAGAQVETYWAKDEKSIAMMVEATAEAGCPEVVFFESTPLEWNKTWDAAYRTIKRLGA